MILLFLLSIVSCAQFSQNELQSIFGSQKCIKGSLASINLGNEQFLKVKDAKSQYQQLTSNLTKLEDQKEKEKSVLSKLHEFSQYNDLDYYFKLEKEEGKAHDKTFTVSLIIGEEKHVGQGKSLKKAKENAATLLFGTTNYNSIPLKDKLENIDDSLTPTVLLNNVCTKLGIKVEYSLLDKEHDILNTNIVISEKSKKSYLQKLNDSLHSNKNIHLKKDLPDLKGPFSIKLSVGDHTFYGSAHSIQAAKHHAASIAIDFLLENKDTLGGDCLEEGSATCQKKKEALKSPISLAYEAAQSRKMYLDCEVVDVSGPDHKKSFTTQCQIGDLVTIGEGRSKKESKRAAAEKILERVNELPPVSKEMQMANLKNVGKNKKKKKKKNKIIRSKLEELTLIAQQTIESTFGFGNNDQQRKEGDNTASNKITSKEKDRNQPYQDEVLRLSGLLGFSIDYSDFSEDGRHFSLLSMHFNPEYICFGEGLSESEARNKAANGALGLLNKLDFVHHFDKQYSSLESDIKASLQAILHLDVKEETK